MTLITLPRSKSKHGVAYYQAGSGKPIVLVHGVGLRAESWYHQIEALAQDHTVYAIDMAGHGDSVAFAEAQPALDQYVTRIADFIQDEIQQAVIMVGHSMGGMVTLRFAERYPALCRGLAVLNAVYRRTDDAKQAVQARATLMQQSITQDMLTAPIQRWFGEQPQGFEKEMSDLCFQWLLLAEPKGYAAAYSVFAREDGASDQALSDLVMPALFLTGDGDKNSSGEMAQAMAELALKGEVVVIEQARHLVQLTHPHAVNQALCDFVKRCEVEQ